MLNAPLTPLGRVDNLTAAVNTMTLQRVTDSGGDPLAGGILQGVTATFVAGTAGNLSVAAFGSMGVPLGSSGNGTETGSTTTVIELDGHGLVVGQWVMIAGEARRVSVVGSANQFTVSAALSGAPADGTRVEEVRCIVSSNPTAVATAGDAVTAAGPMAFPRELFVGAWTESATDNDVTFLVSVLRSR